MHAKALKDDNVEIFVVAVGSYFSGIDEMVRVASYIHQRSMCSVCRNMKTFGMLLSWL
jgi:hypothetical protein